MIEGPTHVNDVSKDLVEAVVEFNHPSEIVEGAINAYKGRTDKVDAPAA